MSGRSALPLFGRSWGAPRVGRGKPLARADALRASSARAPAAFRVSDRTGVSLIFPGATPQIFVHEGARQSLERKLMAAFPGPVVLSITDNRHSIISHTANRGVLRARIHHMFLDAPPVILNALVQYVTRGDRAASARVGQYIEANGDRLDRRARNVSLVTKGKHHDLYAIREDINARYFGGQVNALVTWGKRGPRPKSGARNTIKLGSYSAAERLIRVHPSLDRPWVPRYFVAFIVYHEMLHHVVPASVPHGHGAHREGRRLLHPPEFRAKERAFRHFGRAIDWEKHHLGRLLRS